MDNDCIVLAGGKSSRLERDKSLEMVGGRHLLQRVISVVSPLSRDVIVVKAKGQSFPHFISSPRLRIVSDIYPDKGALGGLYTGLTASNSFYNLVVASDMPFLNQTLLRYMLYMTEGFDAVVPRQDDKLEPIHAIYSQRCIAPIERMLERGDLKIQGIFPLLKVRYLETQEINRFDPQCLSIFNVNTDTDLVKARELAKGEGGDIESRQLGMVVNIFEA